jgi:hypothetical protein
MVGTYLKNRGYKVNVTRSRPDIGEASPKAYLSALNQSQNKFRRPATQAEW